jgi:hypothetical protein
VPLIALALLYLALAAVLATAGHRLERRARRRLAWASALVLTLLPLAYTGRGFLPGTTLAPTPLLTGVPPWAEPERQRVMESEPDANPLLLDPLTQFIPWSRAARRDLLFNPAQGGGAALLGNGQSAVLFPTEALSRLLPPFRALTFSQAARLLLAVWGMFLLARALALSQPAALLAAVAWSGAGFLELWRLHPHSLVAAVLPWVLLALVHLVRRPGPRPAVGLAAAGAVAVAGGHPETLLHGLIFAVVFAALLPWADRTAGEAAPGRAGWGGVLVWGGAAALLAALLAAPVLLPFVDNLRVSSEWKLRSDFGTVHEVPLSESVARLRPNLVTRALGDPVDGTFAGPDNLAELGGGSLGAAALVLAALALAGRRRRLALVLLALGLFGLLASAHLIGVGRVFGAIPLLRESLLKRLSLWWALAVPLAAGLGWDAVRGGLRERRRPWLAPAVAAAVVAAVVAWASGPPWTATPMILWGEWGALAASFAAVLVAVLPQHRRDDDARRPAAAWALVVVAAALLLPRVALFAPWVPPVSAAGFYADTLATRDVGERLAALPPWGWRVAGLRAALVPHSASFFAFDEVRAYDPMTFAPYAEFVALTGDSIGSGWVRIHDPARPALAFLGARFVFEHPSAGHREGVEVCFRGHGGMVYENLRALPRAYLPKEIEAHASHPEAMAAAKRIDDFAERVTVSGLDVGPLPPGGEGKVIPNGAARVEELTVRGRRLTARVALEAPALLATSQPAIPGWRVSVDGTEATAVRVNGAFLGVVLGPGEHGVEMLYAPESWPLGLAAGAVGLLLAALLLWLGRRRAGVAGPDAEAGP